MKKMFLSIIKNRLLKRNREKVRSLGFKIYKYLWVAKFMAKRLTRNELMVHWVLKQPEGYMVLNIDTLKHLNKVNEAVRKIKSIAYSDKIRERDLNRSAIYKTPPINGSVLKICS